MEDMFLSLQKPSDVRSKIGELVKAMRNSRSMTQQELAEKLNLTRLTIHKVENGKNFNIDTLLLILQYFDLLSVFSDFIEEQRVQFKDFGSFY
ncbi:helix-turn-helix transcriptional regulator [Myroides guanonis]|uniref:DNA-binding transcriptional regulator, XRE-family HTH domain n=1 Tax=Myroides guanonis TaxID=1150112 RepID=A0A1I3L2T2_9FLAO|nr:helix-turn-helix transcriptional regulator [Myroides guanonis]SFI78936.1 DNA-binding transcriptional regulator, XRE-family HTH domain [Myroides guanonis]